MKQLAIIFVFLGLLSAPAIAQSNSVTQGFNQGFAVGNAVRQRMIMEEDLALRRQIADDNLKLRRQEADIRRQELDLKRQWLELCKQAKVACDPNAAWR